MTNIRTFIAIELDQTIRKILEDVVIYLKKNNIKDVRWVTPANIHLTLKFLGDTTEDKLPVVYQAI